MSGLFKNKYKIIEFSDCKNESQVIKKIEDKIQHYNHITMISADNMIKIQTCNDKYGRDTDNPYIKLTGSVEYMNGKYVLKYTFDNKIKYIFAVIAVLFVIFLLISLNNTGDIKRTLLLSGIVIVSGGLFTLNNYLNASYNITTIEDFLKKFGEIKEL